MGAGCWPFYPIKKYHLKKSPQSQPDIFWKIQTSPKNPSTQRGLPSTHWGWCYPTIHCQQQGTTKCQHIYWRPGVLLYLFRIFWVPLRKNMEKNKTSWWFQLISKILVKLDHLHEKHLKPPPRREYTAMSFKFKRSTNHADHTGSNPR